MLLSADERKKEKEMGGSGKRYEKEGDIKYMIEKGSRPLKTG